MCGVAEEPLWQRRVDLEHDSMRAALAWLERAGDGERLLRLVVALDRFWSMGGHRVEATDWFARALACGRDAPRELRCQAMFGLGHHLERQGSYERAETLLEDVLAIARESGDQLANARALRALGVVALNQGRLQEAAPLLDDALAIHQRLGNERDQHWLFYLQSVVSYGRDDFDRALAQAEAALAGHRRLDDLDGIAVTSGMLVPLYCDQGNATRAATLLAEALLLWSRIDNNEGIAEWLGGVARLADCRGRFVPAARLYGAAEAAYDVAGVPQVVPPPAQHRRSVDRVRASLGADAFAVAWAAGRALPLEQALAEATTELDTAAPRSRRPARRQASPPA